MSKKGSRGWAPIQGPGQMAQIWLGKGRLREGPEAMETSGHQSVQVLCRMDGDEERMGRGLRDHSRVSATNEDYERKLNLVFVEVRRTGQRSGTSQWDYQCHLLRGNPREGDRFPGGERTSHCCHEISNMCFPPTLLLPELPSHKALSRSKSNLMTLSH